MYVFLVNPSSGNGNGLKVWRRIKPILDARRKDYVVEFTSSAEEARSFVNHFISNESLHPILQAFIVVGGDGTVQSILRELVDKSVPLGIIPAGSGNDFARGLGFPMHVEQALDHVLTASSKKVDVIQVGNQYYITIVGIGLDGEIAYTVNQAKYKRWFNRMRMGSLSYIIGLLQVLLRYQPSTIRIKVDDEEHMISDGWLMAIANLPYYGGGMKIAPEANGNDGLLNLCIVSGISRFKLMVIFPLVFGGRHVGHPNVTFLKGRMIEIVADQPMKIHGDGEVMGETPIQISIQKEALHVICSDTLP